ncbi:HD domain-containing phosphohydrolase [Bermanella sp. R86510]|uniref:HD domain-containing phosphohydrolase n=1 Tax=unclassified Bermanella TaxID=2627862 RepID=UPI0037CAF66E
MAIPMDISTDLLQDLSDELEEKRDSCTQHLLRLEQHPDDLETINLLFRDVHTIKGDLGIMGINQYLSLIQAIEDVLGTLREGTRTYTPTLGDVLLLCLDRVYGELMQFINDTAPFEPAPYEHLAEMVASLATMDETNSNSQALAIIQLLAPETILETEQDHAQFNGYFTEQEINEEVAFFLQLSLLTDQRNPYGKGRTERMFLLAMTMNKLAGNQIDSNQLQAALYLHDVAMAFIPRAMMSKASSLSQNDWRAIGRHMQLAYDLISPYEVWQEAADMIMQHHERLDGSGYPLKLTGEEICDGAKILAIVDSYEAITQGRNYQNSKQRPIMRAIMEINQFAGKLYCPVWVQHFNQAVKQLHVKKK